MGWHCPSALLIYQPMNPDKRDLLRGAAWRCSTGLALYAAKSGTPVPELVDWRFILRKKRRTVSYSPHSWVCALRLNHVPLASSARDVSFY